MQHITFLLRFLGLISISMLIGCSVSDGRNTHSVPAIAVTIQEVELSPSDQQISYSGTIEEALTVPLSFSVPGVVTQVLVNEGEPVRKGQLLALLNSESWQNSLDMAKAKAEQAEDAYNRMLPMHESGSLPEIKFVEIETAVQESRSGLALAQKNFDDCRLLATIDGIVGQRSIEPGMSVMPSANTITLVRIDTVYAKISVSESEIALFRRGMQADVIISALSNEHYTGIVDQIGVVADPLVHTYKVKIAVSNPDHRLLPGMLCNVALDDPSGQAGIVVPTGCVMEDEKGTHFIFTVDTTGNIAHRREVIPGSFVKTGLEITSGLQQGEWIVVSGQQKLTDKSPIHFSR